MNKELIIKARRASIEEYLKGKGEVLSKEGRQYRVENHFGLVVSGNKWYSHTLSKGGNALDYLIEVEGLEFKRAVEVLSGKDNVPIQPVQVAKIVQVMVPKRNADDKRVMAYLVKTRGLSPNVIIPLLKIGRIYEAAKTHNCILTGIDENGTIQYVMQRSTLPQCSLKFESEGSDKRYSFALTGRTDILCIFESPIDLLSYMTLQKKAMKVQPHMLSLGGVVDIALEAYIDRFPEVQKLIFCLDSDKAGCDAYRFLCEKYSTRGLKVYKHFPEQKDWNQQLLCSLGHKKSVYEQKK